MVVIDQFTLVTMKPKISEPEVNAVLDYIEQYEDQPHTHTFKEDFTADETDVVFPAIVKLLLYGANKEPKTPEPGKVRIWHMYAMVKDNDYNYAKEIVSKQAPLLRQLLTDYQSELEKDVKDELFLKKLGDMTGYEFQEYALQIGLIK